MKNTQRKKNASNRSAHSIAKLLRGTGLGLTPLFIGGTPVQHEEFLKPFLSGEEEPLTSHIHSEPGDPANYLEKRGKGLQTTARKEGEDRIVNGDKFVFPLSTWLNPTLA
jgi:nitroalkane oxidase